MVDSPIEGYSWHEMAEQFPLLDQAALIALTSDIKAQGLLNPITIWRGHKVLLDGRNRAQACKAAGIEPLFDEYDGNDPVRFIIAQNTQRRDLDYDQRVFIAAKAANLKIGRPRAGDVEEPMSQNEAATMLRVAARSVWAAGKLLEKGAPDLLKAVHEGRLNIQRAGEIAGLDLDEQEKIAKLPSEDIVTTHERLKRDRRRSNTLRKIKEAAQKGSAEWPQGKQYVVIYVDPPWEWEPYSRDTGLHKSPDIHYPTMAVEEIMRLPVLEIAADNSILFLWVTVPLLDRGIDVMRHWGFQYKTNYSWHKGQIGTGYWNRNEHEHLLIGVRGEVPAPAPSARVSSVIQAPPGEHSAKPEQALLMIELQYPDVPKIELFRRGPVREGWDAWGNEVARKAAESHHG